MKRVLVLLVGTLLMMTGCCQRELPFSQVSGEISWVNDFEATEYTLTYDAQSKIAILSFMTVNGGNVSHSFKDCYVVYDCQNDWMIKNADGVVAYIERNCIIVTI